MQFNNVYEELALCFNVPFDGSIIKEKRVKTARSPKKMRGSHLAILLSIGVKSALLSGIFLIRPDCFVFALGVV